jgi:hypothetical protein
MSASPGSGEATIRWNPVLGATSYTLYSASGAGITKDNYSGLPDGDQDSGVVSPFKKTGLTDSVTYYFVVTAHNAQGESVESSEVSATPLTGLSNPSPPSNVEVMEGNGYATISWNPVAGATSYNAYLATETGIIQANVGTLAGGWSELNALCPLTCSGLTNETTYYIVLTAFDGTEESVESMEVAFTPSSSLPIFEVDIDLTRGTVRFPSIYSNWSVGGAAATNYVAYPQGWSVGGSATANYIALPPSWVVGGSSLANYIGLAPGWTSGGSSLSNYTSLPPGWTTGGSNLANRVSLPSGWTAEGSNLTNWTAMPPGWTLGGSSLANYFALPSGWVVGGSTLANQVGHPPGWTVGGSSLSNYTALPPGWTVGGSSLANYVAKAPGWTVGGSSASNYVAYPTNAVTTMELKYDDPGWLAILQVLKDSGTLTELELADVATYAYFSHRPRTLVGAGVSQGDAVSGFW